MLNEANNRGTEEEEKRFRGATESCGYNTDADREFKARNEEDRSNLRNLAFANFRDFNVPRR